MKNAPEIKENTEHPEQEILKKFHTSRALEVAKTVLLGSIAAITANVTFYLALATSPDFNLKRQHNRPDILSLLKLYDGENNQQILTEKQLDDYLVAGLEMNKFHFFLMAEYHKLVFEIGKEEAQNRLKTAIQRYQNLLNRLKEMIRAGYSREQIYKFLLEFTGASEAGSSLVINLLYTGLGNCESRAKLITAVMEDLYRQEKIKVHIEVVNVKVYDDKKQKYVYEPHTRAIIEDNGKLYQTEQSSLIPISKQKFDKLDTYSPDIFEQSYLSQRGKGFFPQKKKSAQKKPHIPTENIESDSIFPLPHSNNTEDGGSGSNTPESPEKRQQKINRIMSLDKMTPFAIEASLVPERVIGKELTMDVVNEIENVGRFLEINDLRKYGYKHLIDPNVAKVLVKKANDSINFGILDFSKFVELSPEIVKILLEIKDWPLEFKFASINLPLLNVFLFNKRGEWRSGVKQHITITLEKIPPAWGKEYFETAAKLALCMTEGIYFLFQSKHLNFNEKMFLEGLTKATDSSFSLEISDFTMPEEDTLPIKFEDFPLDFLYYKSEFPIVDQLEIIARSKAKRLVVEINNENETNQSEQPQMAFIAPYPNAEQFRPLLNFTGKNLRIEALGYYITPEFVKDIIASQIEVISLSQMHITNREIETLLNNTDKKVTIYSCNTRNGISSCNDEVLRSKHQAEKEIIITKPAGVDFIFAPPKLPSQKY